MRKSIFVAALGAFSVIAAAAPASATTVTVVHGTKSQTVDTTKRPAGGVHVIRPTPPAVPPAPVAAKRSTPARSIRDTYVAGDILWTRNARTGRLQACAFSSSGTVGKYVIRCTSGRR